MEFSYQYGRVMEAFTESAYTDYFGSTSLETNENFPVSAICEVSNLCGEIPTFLKSLIRNVPSSGSYRIVYPMNVSQHYRQITGAETILKEFCLSSTGTRLTKINTPKGETYYGGRGVVFDKDFNPLMYATVTIANEDGRLKLSGYKLHIHPQVFLNDTAIVNKSILKKAIAYFLEKGVTTGLRSSRKKVTVLVDDGSEFFKKPNRPDVNTSNEDFNAVLQEDIAEVLNQLTYS